MTRNKKITPYVSEETAATLERIQVRLGLKKSGQALDALVSAFGEPSRGMSMALMDFLAEQRWQLAVQAHSAPEAAAAHAMAQRAELGEALRYLAAMRPEVAPAEEESYKQIPLAEGVGTAIVPMDWYVVGEEQLPAAARKGVAVIEVLGRAGCIAPKAAVLLPMPFEDYPEQGLEAFVSEAVSEFPVLGDTYTEDWTAIRSLNELTDDPNEGPVRLFVYPLEKDNGQDDFRPPYGAHIKPAPAEAE